MKKNEKFIGADAAKLAGLQIDLLHKIRSGQITLRQLEWFLKLSKGERYQLSGGLNTADDCNGDSGCAVIQDCFVFLNDFGLMVPDDYNPTAQLESFKRKYRKDFGIYDNNITDESFGGVTTHLVPGKKLTVKIFDITGCVSPDNCLTFLSSQNAVLAGAQGLSLTWEYARDKFPIDKCSVSFDKKEALCKDPAGNSKVPFILRDADDDWNFQLRYFSRNLYTNNCLLCFCD